MDGPADTEGVPWYRAILSKGMAGVLGIEVIEIGADRVIPMHPDSTQRRPSNRATAVTP